MSNLIDRQAAIDALNDNFTINDARDAVTVQQYIFRVCMRLKNLPSAQRIGRWIPQDLNKKENGTTTLVWYAPKCSECGYPGNYPATWNYCPSCGARMEDGDE